VENLPEQTHTPIETILDIVSENVSKAMVKDLIDLVFLKTIDRNQKSDSVFKLII
jgi:hypothetical protein